VEDKFATYIIHYTPLRKRRKFIEGVVETLLRVNWITEREVVPDSFHHNLNPRVFSIPPNRIALDLGTNSRSIIKSRRKAFAEGVFLQIISFLPFFPVNFRLGSLPDVHKLSAAILELNEMHVTALRRARSNNYPWVLVLEDDAIPQENWLSRVIEIVEYDWPNKPIWINLNSGANLTRTSSDKKLEDLDLFRVKPPTTRCSTAYLVNMAYIKGFTNLVDSYGLPAWLPIDVIFQVANRKLSSKSYWAEPEIFTQGSESGKYSSNLAKHRVQKNF